jgi:hypothetical protein
VQVIEKYLDAVRGWLPEGQRDDVVAELRDDIRSELEEREAALGRPLDEGELVELLRRRGHPMRVAAPFLPQQSLIGPVLLPVYRRVLRISMTVMLAVFLALYVAFGILLPELGGRPGPASPVPWIWHSVLYSFALGGLVTLIFASAERAGALAGCASAWDPRDPDALPRMEPGEAARHQASARVDAAFDGIACALLLLWITGVLQVPDPEGLTVTPTAAWGRLFWQLVVFAVAGIGVAAGRLLRPDESRTQVWIRVAHDTFGLVLALILLSSVPLVDVAVSHVSDSRVAHVARAANMAVTVTLCVIAFVAALDALKGARTFLYRARRV